MWYSVSLPSFAFLKSFPSHSCLLLPSPSSFPPPLPTCRSQGAAGHFKEQRWGDAASEYMDAASYVDGLHVGGREGGGREGGGREGGRERMKKGGERNVV